MTLTPVILIQIQQVLNKDKEFNYKEERTAGIQKITIKKYQHRKSRAVHEISVKLSLSCVNAMIRNP